MTLQDKVIEVITFLSQPHASMDAKNKKYIADVASVIPSLEFDQQTRETLVSHLQNGRLTTSSFKALIIECLLLELTSKPEHSKRIKDLLLDYTTDLKECSGIMATLSRVSFNDQDAKNNALLQHCHRDVKKHFFDQCVRHLHRIYQEEVPQETSHCNPDHVVVMTRQMQMPPHAPSVRTLEFARDLIRHHNKNVMIVCSSEASSEAAGPVVPSTLAVYSPAFLKGSDNVTFEGLNIPFKLCGNSVFSEETARECIRTIQAFAPSMILSIGAPNMLAEVFGDTRFCFFYMSGHGIPLTQKQHFHTWDQLTPDQEACLKEDNLLDRHLFVSTPGYHKPPQTKTLSRSHYDIPNDAFVFAVIGLRLNKEVSKDFIAVLSEITEATGAYFIFAGVFENYAETIEAHPSLASQCRYIGLQPEIMAVYELCDAYINPVREGGGSSAAQALQAGLPVLSLPTGDVGFIAQGFPPLENYEEMTKRAISLVLQEEVREQYQQIAAERSQEVSTRHLYIEKILRHCDEFWEAKNTASQTA